MRTNVSRPLFCGVIIAAVTMLCCSPAAAESIVRYSVANATNNRALPPSFRHPSISSNALIAAGGIIPNSSSTQWQWKRFNPAWQTYDTHIATDKYWYFSFQVTNHLTSVTLNQLDIRVGRGANAPTQFAIRASVNGGTVIPLFNYNFSTLYSGTAVSLQFQVDLSSILKLRTGDEVFFWLVPYSQSGAAEGNIFYIQNIDTKTYGLEITGEVTKIPNGTILSIR